MTTHDNEPVIGESQIIERGGQPYAGITATVAPDAISEIADRLPGLFEWLAERGIQPAGPPFLRYDVIDMDRALTITAGVPVDVVGEADGDVAFGVLPAGRYVAVRHLGHPATLVDATARLLEWADERSLRFDASIAEDGERWVCRLEIYLTDPATVPDLDDWVTELAFKLAD